MPLRGRKGGNQKKRKKKKKAPKPFPSQGGMDSKDEERNCDRLINKDRAYFQMAQ